MSHCCSVLADPPLDRLPRVTAGADPTDLPLALDLASDACRDPWGSLLARRLGPAGRRDGVHLVRDDAVVVQQGDEVLLGHLRHGCLTDITNFGAAKRLRARLSDHRWRGVM